MNYYFDYTRSEYWEVHESEYLEREEIIRQFNEMEED